MSDSPHEPPAERPDVGQPLQQPEDTAGVGDRPRNHGAGCPGEAGGSGPAAAQAGEQVLLDTTVAAGVRGKRRVVVTDRFFHDGGRSYPFDAITSLTHQITRFQGKTGRTMNFVYDLWMATGGKPTRIYRNGAGPHERGVFDAVVEALHRYVTPRIVSEFMQRMALCSSTRATSTSARSR